MLGWALKLGEKKPINTKHMSIFLIPVAGQSSRDEPHPSQRQTGQNTKFTVAANCPTYCQYVTRTVVTGPVCPKDGSGLSQTPSRPRCLCLLVFSCPMKCRSCPLKCPSVFETQELVSQKSGDSVAFLAGLGGICHPHGWSTWRPADQPTTRRSTSTWGLLKENHKKEIHVDRRVVGWSAGCHVDHPRGWQISPWPARKSMRDIQLSKFPGHNLRAVHWIILKHDRIYP